MKKGRAGNSQRKVGEACKEAFLAAVVVGEGAHDEGEHKEHGAAQQRTAQNTSPAAHCVASHAQAKKRRSASLLGTGRNEGASNEESRRVSGACARARAAARSRGVRLQCPRHAQPRLHARSRCRAPSRLHLFFCPFSFVPPASLHLTKQQTRLHASSHQRWKAIVRDVLARTEWNATYGSLARKIDATYRSVGCTAACRAELETLFRTNYPDQYDELVFVSFLPPHRPSVPITTSTDSHSCAPTQRDCRGVCRGGARRGGRA